MFSAECDVLVPGGVLRFAMPAPDGTTIGALGRIIDVRAGQRLVVMQESPWHSRIEVTFRSKGADTQVTATATVGEDCFNWLLQARGHPIEPGSRADDEIRVGIMLSLSGPAAVFGRACQNAAEMAVDEINLEGGLAGRLLRPVFSDDGTDAGRARREYLRLVDLEQCHAVVAMVSSASIATVRPIALAGHHLLLHSPVHEGLDSAGTVFHLGQDPVSQLRRSITNLMAYSGDRGWAFVGNDYSWPRAVHHAAEAMITRAGGSLLAERFVPLGTDCLDEVIEALADSGATNIISALVGSDAVDFERRFHAAGLRDNHVTFAPLFDEAVREHVGDEAAAGIWSVQSYFREHDTPASRDLNARWTQRFGQLGPPLTSTAATVYDAVHRYARAARQARSVESRAVAEEFVRLRSATPHLSGAGLLAESVRGGFRIHAEQD